MRMRAKCGTLVLACSLWGTVAAADGAAQGNEVLNAVPHEQTLTANPFLLLAEWFNAEYERKVSPSSTLGIAGSLIDLDGGDDTFLSLNAQFRYYPQGAALVGFYVGPRLGYYWIEEGPSDTSEDAVGLGFDVGYNWLLGSERRFAIGLGIGLSRLFGVDDGDTEAIIPIVRLVNIGFAF